MKKKPNNVRLNLRHSRPKRVKYNVTGYSPNQSFVSNLMSFCWSLHDGKLNENGID